eukprot:TRINITY_DN549_c0_g1_i1.p1 TRINITY_DN549_c0_g1~~TRINITY_DN549_c0_g1_i1.p1  ORF type:complete len:155 (-),score=46.09 TRINITY_DN549_c0_g1_i1:376-840(-)
MSAADEEFEGATPAEQLIGAAKSGNEGLLREILKKNPRMNVNSGDALGNTALHWACTNEREEIVKALLAHPSTNVEKQNFAGDTPLHRAVAVNNLEIVKLLVAGRANVESRNKANSKPVHLVKAGNAEMKTFLQDIERSRSVGADEVVSDDEEN